jgi:hypothetical protein
MTPESYRGKGRQQRVDRDIADSEERLAPLRWLLTIYESANRSRERHPFGRGSTNTVVP